MEQEFRPEVHAFERVSATGALQNLLSGANMTDPQGKLSRQSISPEDRFLINVDGISRKWSDARILPLQNSDIDIMLNKSQLMPNIKYKNPTAFILGYWATQGGMNYDNLMSVINNVLPELNNDGGVYPEDVIRYARNWVLYLS